MKKNEKLIASIIVLISAVYWSYAIKKSQNDKNNIEMKQKKKHYESQFIYPSSISGRQEKTTCLRREFHERITKIISPYNNPKLSVFSYIDAVLVDHFEKYKEDIIELHEKMRTSPYKE